MAGGENRVPARRKASRKRPNQAAEENPKTKKRVVLGEITNISPNVSASSRISGEGKTRKCESVLEKSGNEVNQELAVSPESDEPQKYGYAPSMLQYLRSLEVLSLSFCSWTLKRCFHVRMLGFFIFIFKSSSSNDCVVVVVSV